MVNYRLVWQQANSGVFFTSNAKHRAKRSKSTSQITRMRNGKLTSLLRKNNHHYSSVTSSSSSLSLPSVGEGVSLMPPQAGAAVVSTLRVAAERRAASNATSPGTGTAGRGMVTPACEASLWRMAENEVGQLRVPSASARRGAS